MYCVSVDVISRVMSSQSDAWFVQVDWIEIRGDCIICGLEPGSESTFRKIFCRVEPY
jgi:hypothetical protein